MAYFLILLSACCFGWLARELALEGIQKISGYRQNLRLKGFLGQGTKRPVHHWLSVFSGDGLDKLCTGWPVLLRYSHYLARQLQRSGREDLKPSNILNVQILSSLGAFLFFQLLSGSFLLSILAFVVGAALTLIRLGDQAVRRERILLRDLPNALEVLALCCEAGLTVEQGIAHYHENTRPGPLTQEFGLLLEQTKSGSSRKAALTAAADRLRLTDFSLFTTSLIHAEKFGTGVAKTLGQLSLTMRDKQSQRAEKAVQELPVKMLLPLILCILPVTFIVIFGPILLQFFGR